MFDNRQADQIKEKGLTIDDVQQQLENFKNGFPYLKLTKAATLNDGIVALDAAKEEQYVAKYEKESKGYKIVKFVPASGAASRMFKDLFQFLGKLEKKMPEAEINIDGARAFFQGLEKFAFYNDLRGKLQEDEEDIEKLMANKQYISILNALLTDDGLNYGNLPKGLLKFHAYDGFSRTPVEEHFVESAEYAVQGNNRAQIHFTVSPEHIELFKQEFEKVESLLEGKYKINFDAKYSVQKPSTDIVAVDMENNPFTEGDGSLLFRPGGHGALLENLKDLEAEIVFIKNIDNVVPDHLKPGTIKYKKILGGILIEAKEKIFSYLYRLSEEVVENGRELLDEIKLFIEKELFYILPEDWHTLSIESQKEMLYNVLNRPIRVCGMVKNEGEPGGGPFWVKMKNGAIALQIAETSQVDTHNPEQKGMLEQSTHFNPVDIVCYKKDYKGINFDLLNFRDPETGFISKKSKDGKDLKAQELPGLWNGSMAFWNTLFVEVPLETFNPVKTVNDLLRPQHQK
jgi:hypothetical protein